MDDVAGYREELVERLRDLLEEHDRSVASVERELGRGRGYVGDALRGSKRLYVELILEVLEVLGVSPERFFGPPFGYPHRHRAGQRGSSEVAERPGSLGSSLDLLVRRESLLLQALVLALHRRGVLPFEELLEIYREFDEDRRVTTTL